LYSRDDIQLIKRQVKISELLEKHYKASIVKAGTSMKTTCPLPEHNERTPSFHIKDDAESWHCFGCGESGDIFSLVSKIDQISFPEAIKTIIELYNLDIQDTKGSKEDYSGPSLKDLRDAIKYASEWYSQKLFERNQSAAAAIEIIKSRNLNNFELIDQYGVGYAPSGDVLLKEMTAKGYSIEILEKAGLIKKRDPDAEKIEYTDVFKNRLLWTIADKYGKPIGFGGRRINDENTKIPKYLNSSESAVYSKTNVLWGLNIATKAAREQGRIFVAEGYTDVMAINAAGFPNAVAPCGTAFTREQGELIKNLRDKPLEVYFVFDGDKAGQNAALKIFSDGLYDLRYSYVIIPSNKAGERVDPCDLFVQEGAAGLKNLLTSAANAQSVVEFALNSEREKHDLSSPEGRSKYVDACVELLNKVEQYSLRLEYVKIVAREAGWQVDDVVRMLSKKSVRGESHKSNTGLTLSIEDRLTSALLNFPMSAYKMFEEAGEKAFPGANDLIDKELVDIYELILMTMPLLKGEKGAISEDDVNNPNLLNKLSVIPFFSANGDEIKDNTSDSGLLLANISAKVKSLHRTRNKSLVEDLDNFQNETKETQ